MSINFANLWELWSGLADGMSGRTSPILDPPQVSSNWGEVTSVENTDQVYVLVDGPDGEIELTCPSPSAGIQGYYEVQSHIEWRRGGVYSFGENIDSDNIRLNRWTNARAAILTALFEPYIHYSTTISLNVPSWTVYPHPAGAYILLVPANVMVLLDPTECEFDTGPTAETATLETAPYATIDWVGAIAVYDATDDLNRLATPAEPDEQEPLAAFWQNAGSFIVDFTGPEVQAINVLAEAIARSPRDGVVVTHRGKALVSQSGHPIKLDPPDASSGRALERLSAAVVGWFGPGTSLWTARPRSLVSVTRGYLRRY